ncbi:MAG: peptidoglycan DD-metalloendopeptidase family protein [Candidatus Hydrogenedentota bacterium]|nr:MAG: peptidoglycan DD-metalloendopeptidase family protein [Candidatus Hydrogenedentota bacterium]
MEGYNLAVREGFRNFRRKRTLSLAMVGCVAVAVFVIGAFGILALNVNFLLKRWESKVELVAFLSHGLEEQEARQMLERILSMPEVGEARLITGRESWEELFSTLGDSLNLHEVPLDEVLPPSIVIRLVRGNRDLAVIRRVASRVASLGGVDEVKFEEMLLQRYLQLRRDIGAFAVGTSIFGILVFGVITVNIARLASTARKTDVLTLQMLGASTRFIRRVFTVEGIAQGVSGSAVGIVFLAGGAVLLSTRMGGILQLPVRLFGVAFAVGTAVALLASWFSFRNVLTVSIVMLLAAVPTVGLAQTWNELQAEVVKREQQLRQLENELQQNRDAAEKIGRQERAILDELEKIDREMDTLRQKIKAGEANVSANKAAIEEVQAELVLCEAEYLQSRKELEKWLRLLCNLREPTIVEVILYDIPQSGITRRREMISQLAQKEAEALEMAERLRAAVLEQQETLRQRGELDTLYSKDVRLRAQQFAEKRKQREVLLAELSERKSIYLAAISDLEVSAQRLQELIEAPRAEKQPVPASSVPFREMKGLLPWPAEGEVTVPFGRIRNPDSPTYTRHLGIDISAAVGSKVRAVHDAVVAYSDWFRGYGKLVILDHGGGYNTVYSHCSEMLVEEGDLVRAGQAIAVVGETGSLKGPFLYFEIRENGQGVDPAIWLQRRNINGTQSE